MIRPSAQFLFALLLFLGPKILHAGGDDDYHPGPDSIAQAGVPKGELVKGTYTAVANSVFPGTVRDYTIYVPAPGAGFDKTKPSPFMVFQDGVIYNAPVVFDNLIAKHELPPLIGIFIKPGVVPAANPNALPRYNRSYEYDSITDTYAHFLIDEFLPAIAQKHGLTLSTDPNDSAICGNSSGGICAFMTAWHRPDRFRRVFSGVGTYVGIHGADQLPVLVRKMEPKPLRVYLQSGENDNNLYCGDWWMANQTMERSLTWAGYDVAHTWGTGGHNAKHATAIFPDVLRWLWKGWPEAKEIKANPKGESRWIGYQVLGEAKWGMLWEASINAAPHVGRLAANKDGEVFASILNQEDSKSEILVLKPHESVKSFLRLEHTIVGLVTGKNGHLFVCMNEGLYEISDAGIERLILDHIFGSTVLTVSFQEEFFFANQGNQSWISTAKPQNLPHSPFFEMGPGLGSDSFMLGAHNLTLSPDQTILYFTDGVQRYVFSCRVNPEGVLRFPQRYCRLETESDPALDDLYSHYTGGLCVDTNGWLYVATALGVQVCDQAGRVNFIIPTPQQPLDVCFGGKDLSELFIACGDKIYKRPTKAHGIVSGQMPPIKPAPPKL